MSTLLLKFEIRFPPFVMAARRARWASVSRRAHMNTAGLAGPPLLGSVAVRQRLE
jgi:hypothetical protein